MASDSTTNDVTTTYSADEPKPLAPELHPNIDHIVTEDDRPVDNIFSEKQQRLLTEPLYSSWTRGHDRPTFVALSNVGLFFAVHQPPWVPDMMLSLDVELPETLWPKRNRSYFIWEYGKPPEVVIEVVSNREGGEDTKKHIGYARLGVHYYVVFDPERHLSDEILRGFQLVGVGYQRLDEPIWFPGVELGMTLWDGAYECRHETWLRWVDATRQLIPTGAEKARQEQERADQERHRAEQEQQRADHERQRAEQEQRRADQERQRADRLADQLRQLGQQPND